MQSTRSKHSTEASPPLSGSNNNNSNSNILESLLISVSQQQQQQTKTNTTNDDSLLAQSSDQYPNNNAFLEQCQWTSLPNGIPIVPSNCSAMQPSHYTSTGLDLYRELMEGKTTESLNFSDYSKLWVRKSLSDILIRVAFVAPIVLLGILGNLTIIYSMCKFKRFRSKPTNIFILNMAFADILTTLVCPSAALINDIHQFYVLGSFICHFEGFIKITCLLVSSYSLIVLSSDWLICIIQPCRKRISIKQSWVVLAVIWILSIIMAAPLFVLRNLRKRPWKDIVEIWCCETLDGHSKYYWVGITQVLMYLPTIFMTIVLLVILAKMDKFEAKLRRSHSNSQSNCSLSINMKYKRRIVKILFTYLLTTIICWSPFQVITMCRYFRNELELPSWVYEVAFFSSLSASLTAVVNPIIFGFLSQPFRRIVMNSLMFKFLSKIITSNGRHKSDSRNELHAMNQRPLNNNNNNYCRSSPNQQHLPNHQHSVPNHHYDLKQQSTPDNKQHNIVITSNNNKRSTNKNNNPQVIRVAISRKGSAQNNLTRTSATAATHRASSFKQQVSRTICGSTAVESAYNQNSNKRVSFNTLVAGTSERQPTNEPLRQDTLTPVDSQKLGRDNAGFEPQPNDDAREGTPPPPPLSTATKQTIPLTLNGATHSVLHRNRICATNVSFIQHESDNMSPLSFVSMDSINIEESLVGGARGSCGGEEDL